VELESHPRRHLFKCFRHHPLPVFSICTSIDISGFSEAVQQRQLRFYSTLGCLISQAINGSPYFRYRIVKGELLDFLQVHPSINVALADGGFSFADAVYTGHFQDDYASIRSAIGRAREHPVQEFRAGLDDRFFLTHLPWLSFSGIQHPYTPAYASIPIISTGRSVVQEGTERLPIAVQAHHALVDGLHVARLLDHLSQLCRHPGASWG
jgi:chloramphenicol O-acetyltransferase type A